MRLYISFKKLHEFLSLENSLLEIYTESPLIQFLRIMYTFRAHHNERKE